MKINSLLVQPTPLDTIILEIPSSNSLPVAVYILSPTKSMVLEKNAVLINSSGATSGNTFSVNGTISIKNGGKFIHRTIRGNSYLISKLEIDSTNKKGIFEFDVPGNSGYTLSLSGRRFGSLVLNATLTNKKSYSGSGSNSLSIEGDLTIGENASLTSSLNNNVIINGNVNIKGTCSLNPTLPDSSLRDLILSGDTTSISITGKLTAGVYFRNLLLSAKSIQLRSNMEISNMTIKSKANSYINLDSFYIKTNKSILLESFSTVQTSHPEGLSSDSTNGALRASYVSVDSSCTIVFTGNLEQHSGKAIPMTIRAIRIDKSGSVLLDQNLSVKESLQLINGNIKTDSLHKITFKGNNIIANEHSFINGPFEYTTSDTATMLFPVGKNKAYAPAYIKGYPGNGFEIEYFDTSAGALSKGMIFPVKGTSQNEYWKIKQMKKDSTNSIQSINFRIGTNSMRGLSSSLTIVRLNESNHWESLPITSKSTIPNSIETKTEIKSSIYSFGNIQQIALARQLFQLKNVRINGKEYLTWQYDSNDITIKYIIESSFDGMSYKDTDSILSINSSMQKNYEYEINRTFTNRVFYRIRACHKDGKTNHSNIIHIEFNDAKANLFPNPCKDKLYLTSNYQVAPIFWSIDMEGRKRKLKFQHVNNKYELDIMELNTGTYRLIVYTGSTPELYKFLKY